MTDDQAKSLLNFTRTVRNELRVLPAAVLKEIPRLKVLADMATALVDYIDPFIPGELPADTNDPHEPKT